MEVICIGEYLHRLQNLIEILETDKIEIGKAIEGEYCDEYRNIINRELDILYDARKQIYKFI